MATEAELAKLRARADALLRTPACNTIRFRIEHIAIQSFMYGYIGNAIANDRVHLRIKSSTVPSYDHNTDTLTLTATDEEDYVIVHEATHAIIDATNKGQTVTVATGEAVAYVAECVYALNAGLSNHSIDDRHLQRKAYAIARQVRAYSATQRSGYYTVPQADVDELKGILSGSSLHQAFATGFLMDGIYEGPRRGLIGMMILNSKQK